MKRKFLFTPFLALLAVAFTTALVTQSTHLLVKKSPLAEAAAEIKLNGTLAYLWFDEIMSGDTAQSIQEVWYYLEIADWHVVALLEGGESITGSYQPVDDPQLRPQLVALREILEEFRREAEANYRQLQSKRSAVHSLQRDEHFLKFASKADDIQRFIKSSYESGIESYTHTSVTLILAVIVIAIYAIRLQHKHERSRDLLLTSLTDAKNAIEEKNVQLHNRAYFDPLTHLANRTLFLDRLNQSILKAEHAKKSFALLFIDLDHFKDVNDQYGHQVGDHLLQKVAKRINQCIRTTDLSARFSGDEFVVVLDHLQDIKTAIHIANKTASKLNHALSQPFQLKNHNVLISASIGIAIYPEDSVTQDTLIRYADNAMYHAKGMGKNNFQFYSNELNRIAMSQKKTERALDVAIESDQFELYYLPKWNLKTEEIEGVEALVRWTHPTLGLQYPDSFVPVAESTGQIRLLDLLVTQKALAQQKSWLTEGVDLGVLGVNISARSLKHPEFFEQLKTLIMESGVPPQKLEIEITETVMVEHIEFAQTIFSELKSLGVRVALDDFGTGFSSLSYLKDFDFQTLKIDRSFVVDYATNTTSMVLLKSIIQLGKELGVSVIAEGIETAKQQQDLHDLGCLTGQGFYLTPPLPAHALVERLLNTPNHNIVPIEAKT
ncbi:putative Diguanylate cyclase [Vibrio nigripulchritudo SFn27]|uniref:putative bifunctional diguanylate cyclase/phosphodiesterase n=1 Tax=Vibrio nigripulchritudo TaxID=28173 RepID=UPI0003B1A812|nr:EAL domain-containing protein [Vibrio nigripulchritudo]CCN38683.1 putative Diguanylate cyclase [Vibrio nigripulchritudo AM115]CCN44992.1 putative Diguanylate cyclase [Vibrio nigripulchritudo FTn2]CCN79750.1 putative Diguanylate cyclase [Vibrio nigripulchritudo SO65]CCN91972.1 putative Diguanylate cyclase [Vibrio nigripulchritudo SFn27]CCO44006.1 putative Diguanylate cyclase [Vibrio nigripulchritudo SFn135]